MTDADLEYEVASPSPRNRGGVLDADTLLGRLPESNPMFRSYYGFPPGSLEARRGKSPINDYEGDYILPEIVIDIDSDDPKGATVSLLNELRTEYGVQDEWIRPYFSGTGFHIHLPNLFGLEPSEDLPYIVRQSLMGMFEGIDYKPLNPKGLIRLPQTKNEKSGCYKVPLTLPQLEDWDMDTIREYAEKPRGQSWELEAHNDAPPIWESYVQHDVEVVRHENEDVSQAVTEGVPRRMKIAAKTYMDGVGEGNRHDSLMAMASAWRLAGLPNEAVEQALIPWAEQTNQSAERQITPSEVRDIVQDVYQTPRTFSLDNPVMQYLNDDEDMGIASADAMAAEFREVIGDQERSINLRKYWTLLKNDFYVNAGDVVTLLGATGLGKGLRIDEEIPTPEGFVRAGDIEQGDLIYGPNGTKVEVGMVSQIHHRDNYEITFDDGVSIITDDHHQWGVYEVQASNEWEYNTLTTQEMFNKGIMNDRNTRKRFKIELSEPVQYPVRTLPIPPYLLGLWLGDGSTEAGVITTDDDEIVSTLYQHGFRPDNSSTHQRYYCQGMSERLRSLDLLNNKHIPEDYLISSVEQRLALLRGLMDADGSAEDSNLFYNTNPDIAYGVAEIVRSLGGKASVSTKDTGKHKDCYKVVVLLDWNPFALTRKRDNARVRKDPRGYYRYIENIEPVESQPTVCFSIYPRREKGVYTGRKLYLASRDYVVTHNSTLMQNVLSLTKNQRVLHLTLENTRTMTYRRYVQIDKGIGKEEAIERILSGDESLHEGIKHIAVKETAIDIDDIPQIVSMLDPDIVFIDTVDKLKVGRISDLVTKIYQAYPKIKDMAKDLKTIFMLVSHVNRQSAKYDEINLYSGVGGGAIEQNSDVVLSITGNRKSKKRVIEVEKARDQDPFYLQFEFDYDKTFRFIPKARRDTGLPLNTESV